MKSGFLRLLSIALAVGSVYLIIAKYALTDFHPAPQSGLFIPVAATFLHPEIEIPLYCIGLLLVTFGSYVLFRIQSRINDRTDLPDGDHAGHRLKVTLVMLISVWISLAFLPGIVTAVFILLISGGYLLRISSGGKITSLLKAIDNGLDIIIISAAVIMISAIGSSFFTTHFFSSESFIREIQRQGLIYFDGFSLTDLLVTAAGLILLTSLVIFTRRTESRISAPRWLRAVIDLTVISGIVACTMIIVPWDSARWRGITDYAGVIGPVNDILGGKTILVDSYSQYGLIMPYAVSLLYRIIPLTYENFFRLNLMVTAAGFSLIYIVLRKWFHRITEPVIAVLLIFVFHYFHVETNILFYCQLTFLRYGMWVLLLTLIIFQRGLKLHPTLSHAPELILLGTAVFWAFDVGIYILFSYLVYRLVKIGLSSRSVLGKTGLTAMMTIEISLTLIIMFSLITALTVSRTGKFPQWQEFIFHTRLFAENGFGMSLIPPFGPYIIPVGIYLVTFLYLLYSLFSEKPQSRELSHDLPVVGFLTTYGIFSFLYYIGESVPGNVYITIIPAIILIVWFIARYQTVGWRLPPHVHGQRMLLIAVLTSTLVIVAAVYATVWIRNFRGILIHRGPVAFVPGPEFLDDRYLSSVEWLNKHLEGTKPYKRKIAVISEQDWIFLLRTKSVNVIDSGFNYYFTTIAQYQMLCNQLNSRRPEILFVQNDAGWGWTDYLRECARRGNYRLVENIGFLDRWELK